MVVYTRFQLIKLKRNYSKDFVNVVTFFPSIFEKFEFNKTGSRSIIRIKS